MSEELKRFSIAISCLKIDRTATLAKSALSHHLVIMQLHYFIWAEDRKAAEAKAGETASRHYPKDEGYLEPLISVIAA